jgi:hypothetical protein
MLTGELPLGRFAPPSQKVQMDVRLDEVVLHALEREPERRYQQASQVKSDLETIATQPAPAPPSPVEGKLEQLRKQVRGPAIGLLVVGIVNWVLMPFILMIGLPALSRSRGAGLAHVPFGQPELFAVALSKFAVIGLVAAPFILCSFVIYAALKMMRLESYGLAIAAAIVAMFVTPGNCAGFPLGIWALVVLSRHDIREAFQQTRAASAAAGHPPARRNVLLWIIPVAIVVVLASFVFLSKFNPSPVEPASTTTFLKSFETGERPISLDLTRVEGGAWAATCTSTQRFRLFEVSDPGVQNCTLIYRARLKTEGLAGRAYLEMWCRFPGKGEFFSRGLDNVVSGSNDWAAYETPFFLKAGEQPDLLRLNLVVEGAGKIWVKDVELLTGRLGSAGTAP